MNLKKAFGLDCLINKKIHIWDFLFFGGSNKRKEDKKVLLVSFISSIALLFPDNILVHFNLYRYTYCKIYAIV